MRCGGGAKGKLEVEAGELRARRSKHLEAGGRKHSELATSEGQAMIQTEIWDFVELESRDLFLILHLNAARYSVAKRKRDYWSAITYYS